jgi:hypothetical protein
MFALAVTLAIAAVIGGAMWLGATVGPVLTRSAFTGGTVPHRWLPLDEETERNIAIGVYVRPSSGVFLWSNTGARPLSRFNRAPLIGF